MLIGQVSLMVNLARTKINLEKVWLAACMPSMSYTKNLNFPSFFVHECCSPGDEKLRMGAKMVLKTDRLIKH